MEPPAEVGVMVSPVDQPGNGFPSTEVDGSDASRIGARAEERLRSNAYLALKNISCDYKEGILTLRGCLPTYYLRQMAQAAVAGLEGVQTVIDCIEVTPAARRPTIARSNKEPLYSRSNKEVTHASFEPQSW